MANPPHSKSTIICLDLEGVLVPEIWHGVAAKTGIESLRLTTRDIENYDELMNHRLKLMASYGLTLDDIQQVIANMSPLEGAKKFLDQLREQHPVIILSDTFEEFAKPLMIQLGMPTLFCHRLELDHHQRIVNYQLRQPDQKRRAVEAFRGLNYQVLAAGDSYNDLSMLQAADSGFLFRAPDNIAKEHPHLKATNCYDTLATLFEEAGCSESS